LLQLMQHTGVNFLTTELPHNSLHIYFVYDAPLLPQALHPVPLFLTLLYPLFFLSSSYALLLTSLLHTINTNSLLFLHRKLPLLSFSFTPLLLLPSTSYSFFFLSQQMIDLSGINLLRHSTPRYTNHFIHTREAICPLLHADRQKGRCHTHPRMSPKNIARTKHSRIPDNDPVSLTPDTVHLH
jgi:hypothetical protein